MNSVVFQLSPTAQSSIVWTSGEHPQAKSLSQRSLQRWAETPSWASLQEPASQDSGRMNAASNKPPSSFVIQLTVAS